MPYSRPSAVVALSKTPARTAEFPPNCRAAAVLSKVHRHLAGEHGRTSANDDLSGFIQAAKDRGGVADAFIVELLRQKGWAERHVYRAFSKYYAQTLPSC